MAALRRRATAAWHFTTICAFAAMSTRKATANAECEMWRSYRAGRRIGHSSQQSRIVGDVTAGLRAVRPRRSQVCAIPPRPLRLVYRM